MKVQPINLLPGRMNGRVYVRRLAEYLHKHLEGFRCCAKDRISSSSSPFSARVSRETLSMCCRPCRRFPSQASRLGGEIAHSNFGLAHAPVIHLRLSLPSFLPQFFETLSFFRASRGGNNQRKASYDMSLHCQRFCQICVLRTKRIHLRITSPSAYLAIIPSYFQTNKSQQIYIQSKKYVLHQHLIVG